MAYTSTRKKRNRIVITDANILDRVAKEQSRRKHNTPTRTAGTLIIERLTELDNEAKYANAGIEENSLKQAS